MKTTPPSSVHRTTMVLDSENRIEDELSCAILLSERVRSAAEEAYSFKPECSKMAKQVDRISHMLRAVARSATAPAPPLYERPVRRVAAEARKSLEKSLTLARKCKRQSVLRRVVSITGAADFRRIDGLLENSAGDLRWLLTVLDPDAAGGIVVSLPPIASTDPILSWIWSFIATVQMGRSPADRAEAANELASLAADNDRNKNIIVEELGIAPILKLLKQNSSPDAQIAAITVLHNLADDQERVGSMAKELAIPILVQVLRDSPVRVQIPTANLISRMAELDKDSQEDFARENAIRPLVTLLSIETPEDDDTKNPSQNRPPSGKQSINSIIQINKEMEKHGIARTTNNGHYANSISNSSLYSESTNSTRGGYTRKDRENEPPEVKHSLKTSCAKALWMLARGSVSNCRRITETKGLLCLAKLVETGQGELQFNCLMAIAEITNCAESDADLRRAAFKTNSSAAKAVVEQLLRLIKDADTPSLQVPAIKSIGSLARTFPARETRVIVPLVTQLSSRNQDVATESAIALGKFASPENFLYAEHSKAIIELSAVPPLMRLQRGNERAQFHALVLLCYLALHAGNSEALEQAGLLTMLEGADRAAASKHPELRELVSRAIYHLNLYHSALNPQEPYEP